MSILFWSDPHRGHRKILEYTNRPFLTIEDHDRVITENYQSTVKPEDDVYILGDLSLNTTKEECREWLLSLNGTKILVKGNHDKYSKTWYLESGFQDVAWHKEITYQDYTNGYTEITFLLTHIPNHPRYHADNPRWEPIKVAGSRVVNIHGHCHKTSE